MVHKKSGGLYSEHMTKFNQDPGSATVQCRNCVWIRLSDNVKVDNPGRAPVTSQGYGSPHADF